MYAPPLAKLIEELGKLPGIGKKSASRIAFHIMNCEKSQVEQLCAAISSAKESIILCDVCQNLTDKSPCAICGSKKRNHGLVCVVETPRDIVSIEKTREYNGLYHCLHGCISPMDGIGPDALRIKQLISRVSTGAVEEIILATGSSVEGEATAMYIANLVKPFGAETTRIAHGIPIGADLEFADQITLARALAGRRRI